MDTARDFIQLHMPVELLRLCDLTTLKLESGSFIEEDLRAYFSDVLYSLKTTTGEGYIHVLIEHQSTPDRHMAFRLLQLIALINYLMQAGETSDGEAFVRTLAQRVPQHEDALMTIAQQLEQKGVERGMEKGRKEEALKIARNMLQNGIDRSAVIKMTGVTEDELAQIPQ